MTVKKTTRPKNPPKAMPKPRGSLQEATKRSKAVGAALVQSELQQSAFPAEHEFADSRYANEPSLHRDVRLFIVRITYCVILKNESPIQCVMSESVANHSHDIEIAVIGDDVDPNYKRDKSEKYPTHDELRGTGSTKEEIFDEVTEYYGLLAVDRFRKDTDGQVLIKALTVTEQQMPTLFINGIP